MVDGGTTFAFDAGSVFGAAVSGGEPYRADVAGALGDLRDRRLTAGEEQAERDLGGRVLELPLPQVEIHPVTGETRTTIGLRVKSISGERRQCVSLMVEEQAYIRLNLETGRVSVQLKKYPLWLNRRDAIERWLGLVTFWCTGEVPSLAQLAAHGWRTTNLELCSDFIGLSFGDVRAEDFIGCRRKEKVREQGNAEVETIALGSRSSRRSDCIYNKTKQIRARLHGDDSTYRQTWASHGYGDEEGDVWRVELRLTDGGLCYRTPEGEIDLRDPATLCDHHALGVVWASLYRQRRLIQPTATRRERSKIDPRWSAVIDAAEVEPVELEQDRTPQSARYVHRVRMAIRGVWAHGRQLQCLTGMSEENIGDLISDVGYGLANDEEESRKTLEHARRFRSSNAEYIGEEIRTLGPRVRDRIARSARRRPSLLTPPSKRSCNVQPMPADVRDG
jgi:hypothetical protein